MLRASLDPALRARIVSVRPLPARAGSAVVFHERRLLVIQDDALSIVSFDPRSGEAAQRPLEGNGRALRKAEKPDFEAAFLGPGRALTILGSGSAPPRRRAARVDLETGDVIIDGLGGLYDALEAALGGRPNIEGALLAGDALRLFHRGAGRAPSAVVEASAEALRGGATRILGVSLHDLGEAGGVPLHFADAASARGRDLYLAVAEDTPNAIDDGSIAGAAIGVIEGGTARYTLIQEASGEASIRKLEGIVMDPERGTIYAVSDPDDEARPAELCVLEIEGFFL